MSSPESSQVQIDPQEHMNDKEQQFLDMVNTYQDAIFRFLYFRMGNRAVALDISQDTFTKTWLYLNSGKQIQYEEAFLYRTAKNALVDYFKKKKTSSLDILMEAGYDPSTANDIDEIFRADDIETVRTLLEDFDEDTKQIIFLRYTEERPIEEIAEIYGKSINAMTVQIHRIIKKLRDRYESKHGT